MTERKSSDALLDLANRLDRLSTGATPDQVIDRAFVDALVDWLGPTDDLSADVVHSAVTQLQTLMSDDALVASIRQENTLSPEQTIGQVMNDVRAKARWNVASVAQKLGLDTTLIERMERDLVPLGQLTVWQWAALMELFRLHLDEFKQLATRTLAVQHLHQRIGAVHGRSRTDAQSAQHGRELASALGRALPAFSSSSASPSVGQRLLDELAAELRRRERVDLLGQ